MRSRNAAEPVPYVLLLLIASTASADWPFARGGFESTGAASFALPDEPEVVWTYDAQGSPLEATPVVADGVAYFGDADGAMHAVRVADGSPVWKRSFEGAAFISPPALMKGTAVFAPDMNGVVHCLGLDDGAERWTFDTQSEVYAGPLVVGAGDAGWLVLVPTEAGTLYAIDAATGQQRWEFAIDAPLRCTPTLVSGHALLAGCDGKLHTLDVANGQETGSCDIADPTGNTAAVVGGVAYFGNESGAFLAVDASSPKAPKVKWRFRDPSSGQGVRTAAALTKDAATYANQGKLVVSLRTDNGDERWRRRTRARVEASPLALADGRVLVATTRGRLMLLDPATGDPTWDYETGGAFIASPSASDGVVLLPNTDGRLYALGKKEEGEPQMDTDKHR